MKEKDKILFEGALEKLDKKQLKLFYTMIVHYWAEYRIFISKRNFFNMWCEFNWLCHEMDESFPDCYDDYELIKSFCHAHPYYFIDMLDPRYVKYHFCQYFDDRIDILIGIAQKLHSDDLRAAYVYSNKALDLNENIDELVEQTIEHIRAYE